MFASEKGDGATPFGSWPLRELYYRPDRIARPRTCLPVTALRRQHGWCDAAGDRNYNRKVTMPYAASAESLWRDDHVYDLIVVLGFNDLPRRQGGGSAIFMHIAHDDMRPTAGCIALSRKDLLRVVEACPAPLLVDTRGAVQRTRRGFI